MPHDCHKTENSPHVGYYKAAQRASLIVSGAMIIVAFFIFMAVDVTAAKARTTVQGRVYMGQDGLVLETYSGEIYFLRGGNMGQYEGLDVKVDGFLKQDEAGLSLLTVKNCEIISDDQYGEEAEDEEDSASGASDSAVMSDGPAVNADRGAR